MDPWQAAILGVVEGLTEFLPVSSTGHLILASKALHLHGEGVKTFEVVIQSGALLAVLGLYRHHVRNMLQGLCGKHPEGRRLLINLLISFTPAAFLGLLLHKFIKQTLFGLWPVVTALAVGGVAMIIIDRWQRSKPGERLAMPTISPKQALVIGCAQCVALWPGTSRSMATIVGGMCCGLSPKAAAEYSFLLALPTLGAATLLDGYVNRAALVEAVSPLSFLVGMVTTIIVAALAVKGLIQYLTRHGLELFGWYRIGVALTILVVAWPR